MVNAQQPATRSAAAEWHDFARGMGRSVIVGGVLVASGIFFLVTIAGVLAR